LVKGFIKVSVVNIVKNNEEKFVVLLAYFKNLLSACVVACKKLPGRCLKNKILNSGNVFYEVKVLYFK
jgi:hypothetical protein